MIVCSLYSWSVISNRYEPELHFHAAEDEKGFDGVLCCIHFQNFVLCFERDFLVSEGVNCRVKKNWFWIFDDDSPLELKCFIFIVKFWYEQLDILFSWWVFDLDEANFLLFIIFGGNSILQFSAAYFCWKLTFCYSNNHKILSIFFLIFFLLPPFWGSIWVSFCVSSRIIRLFF